MSKKKLSDKELSIIKEIFELENQISDKKIHIQSIDQKYYLLNSTSATILDFCMNDIKKVKHKHSVTRVFIAGILLYAELLGLITINVSKEEFLKKVQENQDDLEKCFEYNLDFLLQANKEESLKEFLKTLFDINKESLQERISAILKDNEQKKLISNQALLSNSKNSNIVENLLKEKNEKDLYELLLDLFFISNKVNRTELENTTNLFVKQLFLLQEVVTW